MVRRWFMAMIALATALAAGWFVVQLKRNGTSDASDVVQWPFDTDELRALMSRVVAEQAERVSSIQDDAGRNRAQAFLDYYERRRRAVTS